MKKYILIISSFYFILTSIIFAQSFEASVSSNKVGLNNRFEISFTFSGDDINSIKNFNAPDFSGFLVLSGPNQSTSMQIINGAVSASKTLSYILQPKNLGTYNISSASIEYKGTTLKTVPIKIEVIQGTSSPNKADNNANVSSDEIAQNLFIRATVDKNRVYIGEQVTVVYKLYTRLNIAAQMSVSKLPQYQGFWAEELETSNNISFTIEVVDGKQYRVGVLKRVALFPSQPGELTVTAFELTVPVQIQRKKNSNNVFDDFFGDPFGRGETIQYQAKSNTLKINVKQLPGNNKPPSFNGAVGNFTFNAVLDKKETKANEPVSLKLSISGSGNIKLVGVNDLILPPGIEKYDPKTSEDINRSNKVSGKKTIEYLLVPRAVGYKEIPAVEFSYFDPVKEQYVTLSSDIFTINVTEGDGTESFTTTAKENIKMLGQDIRFIKTNSVTLTRNNGILLHRTGFWIAVVLPLLIGGTAVSWKIRNDRLSGDIKQLKFRQAEKVARTRLKSAKRLMELNDDQNFYTEISQALFGYLEDKLQIPKAEFTLDRAIYDLEKKKLDPGLSAKLISSIEKCEYVRFAPEGNKQTEMNHMYSELTEVIIGIEKVLSQQKNV